MKKLLIILMLFLVYGCATGKQAAPGYSIVETTKEYTVYQEDKTGELHKVDNSVMNCKYELSQEQIKRAKQKNKDDAAEWTEAIILSIPDIIH